MHGEMQLVEAQQNSDDKPCLTPTKTDSTRSPSSSCGSPFGVSTGFGLHPYAEKLPRPKVVDDDVVDTDNEAKYLMLQELVSKLLFDSSHILSMYSALQKRLLSQSKQVESDANKKFDTAATIGGLTQIAKNYDWFWMDVAEHTDIGPTKLNVADALNPDSTLQLWQFDTQISLNLKTTPELLVKPIMKKIATACREMHGNRLKDVAKLNPIDSVKGVLWGAVPGIGAYSYEFGEDGFLEKIRHCSGDEVSIPEGQSVITKKYKACELYLDWSAAFVFPNLPPIRLHTFFKAAKSGPYKYQPLTRSSKVWMNIVAKAKADYEASLLPREVDSKVSDPNLAVGLNELHKQQEAQKKALPKASRSQAQEALARKRARKTVAIE